MASKVLHRGVLIGLLVLPLPMAGASNPHTVDGQDCGAWLSSAPLPERARQSRACEGFKTAKAYQLAEEFELGNNGLPKDWGYAAAWYRETINYAAGLSPDALGSRRAEAARQRLAEMLQTGGPGLDRNLAEAQRMVPANLRPGLWEFTTQARVNGQPMATEYDGPQSLCVTAGDLGTKAPFSLAAVADNYLSMGCKIEEARIGALDAAISADCEESYDEAWGESYGEFFRFKASYQGEAAEFGTASTSYPEGVETSLVTTARRLRDC